MCKKCITKNCNCKCKFIKQNEYTEEKIQTILFCTVCSCIKH